MSLDAGSLVPQRIRANKKALEAACLACGGRFSLGEEVWACPRCGQFHHANCFDPAGVCSHGGAAFSSLPPPTPFPTVDAQPAAAAEPPAVALAADEQRCSNCGQIIKRDALKCRHCGYVVDAELASTMVSPETILEINKAARTALTCGIIGLFICGPVLGTMAIVNGNKAIRLMDEHPGYDGPRGKARTGAVLGWVGWVLLIIGIFARLAAS
jgi:predicted RNA-binding Zn-ribbon protein involved in translation (DUF1610 family)